MRGRGTHLLIDSTLRALGITGWEALTTLCHRELRLVQNTYLFLNWGRSDRDWVVNPDGERHRRSLSPRCYWVPETEAISLLGKLDHPDEGSLESRLVWVGGVVQGFLAAAYARRKEEKLSPPMDRELLEASCHVEHVLEMNAYLWHRSRSDLSLKWVSTGAHFERRRTLDALSFWAPKARAVGVLRELHDAEFETEEAVYREVSGYIKKFREAASLKYRQVELQLQHASELERRQLKLKGC